MSAEEGAPSAPRLPEHAAGALLVEPEPEPEPEPEQEPERQVSFHDDAERIRYLPLVQAAPTVRPSGRRQPTMLQIAQRRLAFATALLCPASDGGPCSMMDRDVFMRAGAAACPSRPSWCAFGSVLCRQTGSWQSTDAAAAGVSWDDSCVTSNGHQKRIVAIGGDGLRPTAETPADWVLTIDSMGEGYFICVGIIANTTPDVHGTTQNDDSFHGLLSKPA